MGHLDIGMRLAGSGAEPVHGLLPRGEGPVRPGGGRPFASLGRDNFGEALPLAPGACPELGVAEELEMLAPECLLVELGEEEVSEPRHGAELLLEEETTQETTREATRQGPAPRPRAARPQASREPEGARAERGARAEEGVGAEEETFEARPVDLPSTVVRPPEVRVAKRVGSARGEELAQHLAEELRGLGLQVRLSQLPRAERARQLWSLFLEYAQAAAQQGPAPREVRKALEQVLVRHGFQSLREERSGQSGVALARWVLQSRSPEQVRQRGEVVRLELCLESMAAGAERRGTGLLPVWLRQLGQRWAPPVLAWVQQVRTAIAERLPQREGAEARPQRALVRLPVAWVSGLASGVRVREHVPRLAGGLRELALRVPLPRLTQAQGAVQLWSTRVLAALQQALPQPAPVAVPPRAPALVMELPVVQPAKAGQLKAGQAEAGQVELAAQNLAEGLRRIEVRAERAELPRPERIRRMWNAFLQHAQAAVAEGASPRRLREAFEPVLVRHGFQEMRDAGTERSGVSAALWVLLGGTPEQVRERGAEVRLEPGAVEHRTQSELAATQPELAQVEAGRAREAQQGGEPARARWGWLPSWVPLEPALQLRPPRPGEEEAEPLRQGLLQRLRRGRSLLWGALERFRALPGQGALERSEWNRLVFLAVSALLGLWVATTLLLYAL